METDRLVVIIASIEQTHELSQILIQHHFYFTRVDNASGLIVDATVCLLVGIPHNRMKTLTQLIKKCCEPRLKFIPARLANQAMQIPPVMIEAEVGGATVYTFEVDHFERF
ncbi:MAG TPA: cyclic-di-AMP receptor [Levilinea sp.]|nr:cyclic-di-AMP receptor [Levilinea sp.]